MVGKTHAKRRRDIKTKLMAAVAMLLVSSIMMVSTTYAWFTLSTAPEVTGISTSVGANGNLEMKLQPYDGNINIESQRGDSVSGGKTFHEANVTWGNLVYLENTNDFSYGLENIVLYPSQLNVTDGKIDDVMVSTPEYGADGRVIDLVKEAFTGVYNNSLKAFLPSVTVADGENPVTIDKPVGVRAIGTASGMTDRQNAYRNALSEASSMASRANSTASIALNANGTVLATMAVTHATDASATFTDDQLTSLLNITNALNGTAENPGAIQYIENALIKYGLAGVLATCTDDDYANVIEEFENVTIDNLVATLNSHGASNAGITDDIIAKVNTMKTTVNEAKSTVQNAINSEGDANEWSSFSGAVNKIAATEYMNVCGIPVDELMGDWQYHHEDQEEFAAGDYTLEDGYVYKDGERVKNLNRLINKVLAKEDIVLTLKSGAGVFVDIADFCGNYSADVDIRDVSYGGMSLEKIPATMMTQTNINPVYLTVVSNNLPTYTGNNDSAASQAINEFYGYIIDLAFRTNVSGSYLKLQQQGIDRVYGGTSENEDTMGHGATMTFASDDTQFGGESMKALMGNLKIVFFDTDTQEIITYAKLDTNSASTSNGQMTVPIVVIDENGVITEDQKIMDLEQSVPKKLSVMVYLDGTTITNADVANAARSLYGSMNLQFASSAELVPMSNASLIEGDEDTVVNYGKGSTGGEGSDELVVKEIENPTVNGGTAKVYYIETSAGSVIVVTNAALTDGELASVTYGDETVSETSNYGNYTGYVFSVDSEPETVVITLNPVTTP